MPSFSFPIQNRAYVHLKSPPGPKLIYPRSLRPKQEPLESNVPTQAQRLNTKDALSIASPSPTIERSVYTRIRARREKSQKAAQGDVKKKKKERKKEMTSFWELD